VADDQLTSELELRDYLRVLSRRKWTVALAAAVVLGSALAAAFLQTPVYQGTAEVLLQPRSTESLFNPSTGQRADPARAVQTEIEVLKSGPVQAEVRRRLGRAPDISAGPVGQTDVIRVRARSTEAKQAAAVANAYAEAYIDFRRKQAVGDLVAAGEELQRKVDSLQAQIDPLTQQVNAADPKGRGEVEARVRPQLDSLLSQQALFKQKLDQLQVDAALKTGGAQLVTPATTPSTPVEPRPVRTGAVALVVGLLFGVGLAFLFDYLDDSIKAKEDVERAAPGVSVLGFIPAIPGWRDRQETRLISLSDPSSPASEAYRSLRTSVQFLGLDRPLKTVLMTSPGASEGKTTTLANLAVALARAGQQVIVVCCDLRRPRVHEFFGLSNATGFTSVLLGETALSTALQPVRSSAKLRLLASGPLPPNPSELLASDRAVELFDSLRRQADIVLIDAPPVLPVTDAAVLSSRVDATLLVATANVTTRKALGRAVEVLAHVDAPLVGTVLNGVDAEGGYGYGYGYGYYQQEPERSKARRRFDRRKDEKAAATL
jgi:succinoglycan biosynthesis transport protein ExoP